MKVRGQKVLLICLCFPIYISKYLCTCLIQKLNSVQIRVIALSCTWKLRGYPFDRGSIFHSLSHPSSQGPHLCFASRWKELLLQSQNSEQSVYLWHTGNKHKIQSQKQRHMQTGSQNWTHSQGVEPGRQARERLSPEGVSEAKSSMWFSVDLCSLVPVGRQLFGGQRTGPQCSLAFLPT